MVPATVPAGRNGRVFPSLVTPVLGRVHAPLAIACDRAHGALRAREVRPALGGADAPPVTYDGAPVLAFSLSPNRDSGRTEGGSGAMKVGDEVSER